MGTDISESVAVKDDYSETDPRLYKNLLILKSICEEKQERLTKESLSGIPASDLGFFSKPFIISHDGRDYIVKLYPPVKNSSLVSEILENHSVYIRALRNTGIRIPSTVIFSKADHNKHRLVIIQEAFTADELIRNRIIMASEVELRDLCYLIYDDIIRFWRSKPTDIIIGFHPTLRNYSIRNGSLSYFDTFPPMMFCQKELNRIILYWSPFGGWIKKIVPLKLINRVSDEYYCLTKMFSGIVGSCCRLRPDDSEKILAFSRDYVEKSCDLMPEEKKELAGVLSVPPRLSAIWLLIRLLSGNRGKPNV